MAEDHTVEVMVVEDERVTARDLQSSLESMGYTATRVAATGDEAIELVAASSPDAVIMDIRLRGAMDGIETAERIASELDVPVIFLTAFSDDELIQRAKQVGSYGYLTKPFQEREVYATIEMALTKHRIETERKRRLAQLESEHQKIAAVCGMIPICARCKKVRNDQGMWERLEAYFGTRTGAKFTHWLCPTCYDDEMAKLEAWEREQDAKHADQ